MSQHLVGFACAYTPLPLLHAAGLSGYRLLPVGEWSDGASGILHDNLCPHVKRILDRALADDVPELTGAVFMNSCDAMRRLADGWKRARPNEPVVLVDLPSTAEKGAVAFLTDELLRLKQVLERWTGKTVTSLALAESVALYDSLAGQFAELQRRRLQQQLDMSAQQLQELHNQSVTQSAEATQASLQQVLARPIETDCNKTSSDIPVVVFGNVLAAPEAFALFESCGARVVAEDICTGSRVFTPLDRGSYDDPMAQLAHGLLAKPRCSRTMVPENPGQIAQDMLQLAQRNRAQAAIFHTLKFCDPYLGRVPGVRATFRQAGIPLLVLEGDCTMRSMGQQRTRIEAFVEMLR